MSARFLFVSVAAASVIVATGYGWARLAPITDRLGVRFFRAFPAACVPMLALYVAWLVAERRGDAELRATIAASLLTLGGFFVLFAMVVSGRLLRRLVKERASIEHQLEVRTADLREALALAEQNHAQLSSLIEAAEVTPFEYSARSRRLRWSRANGADRPSTETTLEEYLERHVIAARREGLEAAMNALTRAAPGTLVKHEYQVTSDGAPRSLLAAIVAQPDERLRGFVFDVTALRVMEAELAQSQRLQAVGKLATGLAHELNTPLQFISDNVSYALEAAPAVLGLTTQLEALARADGHGEQVDGLRDAADLEFAKSALPSSLERALAGASRVSALVRAMSGYARPDATAAGPADLNASLRDTALIAAHEYRDVAELHFDLEDLPPVTCHQRELNEVFLHLLVNAAHAIADQRAKGQAVTPGTITLRSRVEADAVVVSVRDTGVGISAEVAPRVFEPFFTTKEVGRGSGQGLDICRRIVVERHGGRLWFDTTVGEGTTFFVSLPLERRLSSAPGVKAA